MVFYYAIRGGRCRGAHSNITLTSDDITCYVGRDKHENEYLIRYGWPGDVWFHVSGISSAHVYFRLDCFAAGANANPHVQALLGKIHIDDLPEESVEDMCQIVKHNSIKGCKMASCKIVYTPHSNLKKEERMDSGTVTYHDTKLQRLRRCDKDRNRIKELEATKSVDMSIDYYAEMKANERRIIDHKKKLKKTGGLNANSVGVYDPVLNDLRAQKAKMSQQGDTLSGIDSGLAALEGMSLGTTTSCIQPRPQSANTKQDDEDEDDDEDENHLSHLPIWQQEATRRVESHGSERMRHFLARGYTVEEILAATKDAVEDESAPFSSTLSKLWSSNNATSATSPDEDLLAQIYEARNEEKEVLEAIYGEDDHVQLGWRKSNPGDEDENDVDDDDDFDLSKPFPFDSMIPIPGYEPPSRYEFPPPLLMEISTDHGVSNYPFGRDGSDDVEPPALAIVGGGLPFDLLRKLTKRLREAALERSREAEGGEAQIFDLLTVTGELVEALVVKETNKIEEEAKRLRAERVKAERVAAKEEAERLGIVGSSSTKMTFRTEADRRAYAASIVKLAF